MPSTPPRHRRFPFISVRAGSSTAQAGLAKIVNIIVTVPPPLMQVSLFGSGACPHGKDISTMQAEEAFDLDLRLGLSLRASQAPVAFAPATEANDQNSTAQSGIFDSDGVYTVDKIPEKKPIPFNAISQEEFASDDFAVADKSSEGECSAETKTIAQRATKISELTYTCCKDEDIVGGEAEASVGKGKEYSGEGYLDLLWEAALLVSSEGGSHAGDEVYQENASAMTPSQPPLASKTVRGKRSSSGEMHRSKRAKTSSAAAVGSKEYENTEPIIRSKRGRTLVLPSRYRDSILEPWRKAPTVHNR